MEQHIQKTIENLEKNGMEVCYVPTADAVPPAVKERLKPGDRVAVSGSVSLLETGVPTLLRSGDYVFVDRDETGITPEEKARRMVEAFETDVYFCSANAITEAGELYHVDGLGNRVGAISFGPKKVILVVGVNKIVPNLTEAIRRVKTVAAPQNTKRLGSETPCAVLGQCITVGTDRETEMTAGCASPQRICCKYLISGKQRVTGRLCVLLCGEPLGF